MASQRAYLRLQQMKTAIVLGAIYVILRLEALMEIIVCGAAGGEVTGSAYLVRTNKAQVLIDFGLFQGSSHVDELNVMPPQIDPEKLTAVVLTHAHLDHTGRLPLLTKHGYKKPIFATPATIMMANLILTDSAFLQRADAERWSRRHPKEPPMEPLYTAADVEALNPLYRELDYGQATTVARGISITAHEAGHMLGSTSLEMTIEDNGTKKVVVFSGDLGPRGAPILRDSHSFSHADLVFMESTYGDRNHRPLLETAIEAREIINKAIQTKGKILVPVFAVGRAQLLLYLLAGAFQRKTLPPFPIYLDSPMAIKATQIYREHVELFDEEALAMSRSGELSANLRTLKTCESAAESKALNEVEGPCMILAGSGMCTGGRILHHLRHNLSNPSTKVLIVGYQSHGSLGRRLVDRAETVRIFGDEVQVRASIHTLGGFSAHAGQTDLMNWIGTLAKASPSVVLTHGEDQPRQHLGRKLRDDLKLKPKFPALGETIAL